MTLDLGTGDGRAILATATAEPTTLAIGLDANAASMAESARRAARAGIGNVLFVVAAVEALPPELAGLGAMVTVRFPWGSLLRGCVGLDATVARGVAAVVAPGGQLALLLAQAARDDLDGIPTNPASVAGAVASTFEPLGFETVVARLATDTEIRASNSTWAKRLLSAGSDRPVTLVRLRSSQQ